jgi:hypothetical protein
LIGGGRTAVVAALSRPGGTVLKWAGISLCGSHNVPLGKIRVKVFAKRWFRRISTIPSCTQGLIEILGSMVIFDENQAVSDINKYEFLCPIYAKIINFLVI